MSSPLRSKREALAETDTNSSLPLVQPCKRARQTSSAPTPTPPSPLAATELPVPPPALKPLRILDVKPENWTIIFEEMCDGRGPKTGNDTGPSKIKPLTDVDLKFPQYLPYRHCWGLWTTRAGKQTPKLKEGGTNNNAPRMSARRIGLPGTKDIKVYNYTVLAAYKANTKIGLPGTKDTKVYNYHVLAAHKANTNPSLTLNIDLLRAVSIDKKEDKPWTVLHLYRHKWCHNPDHLAVSLKVFNDEQTWCHRMLQSAETKEEYNGVRKFACKHKVKCWTVVYSGVWKDSWVWS